MQDKVNLKGQAWVELPGYVKTTTEKAVKYAVPSGHFHRDIWIPRTLTQGEPKQYESLFVREWFIIKNKLMPLEGTGKNIKIKGTAYER